MNKYLTEKDISEMLQINERKAKALLRTQGCPSIHLGTDYRVDPDKFVSWLESSGHIKYDYRRI